MEDEFDKWYSRHDINTATDTSPTVEMKNWIRKGLYQMSFPVLGMTLTFGESVY